MALLRWYGSPGFFDSGLQVICIVGSGVSHLSLAWQYLIIVYSIIYNLHSCELHFSSIDMSIREFVMWFANVYVLKHSKKHKHHTNHS